MRTRISRILVLCILTACVTPCFGVAFAADSPNILWLSTEDIGPHLGSYGHPDAITPTLDRLAANGIRFTRAFTAAPVCAPNRSCIITGVYPSTLGTHHMRSGGEGVDRSIKPKLPDEVKCFTELLRDAGFYATNNSKEDYNFVTPDYAWDESGSSAHWRNRAASDRPFFAVFNYTGTHEGSVRSNAARYAELTKQLKPSERRDPEAVHVPPFHPDTPVVRRQWANYHELITGMDYWVADRLRELEDAGVADDTIVFFWSDHGAGLPRSKRWLYDSGVHIPLIVFVPEKWREKLGIEPGSIDEQLVSSIDFAPTVLKLLDIPAPEYMQGRNFLGPVQSDEREYVYAVRDRMDERYDLMRMVRDKRFKYIRNYEPFRPYLQFLNTAAKSPVQQEMNQLAQTGDLPSGARWAAATRKPVEELYDLKQDPNELNNLADTAEFAEDLSRMRDEHTARQDRTRDLGLIPEPQLARFEMRFDFRYRIASELTKNDPTFFDDLSRVAMLAGNPGERHEADFLRYGESPHASIRYWAVKGLGKLPEQTKETSTFLRERLEDAAPVVRVAAAEALCVSGSNVPEAVDLLIAELGSDEEWVRLHAAIALDDIDKLAEPAIPALHMALEDRENKYVVRVANRALNELLHTNREVR